MHRSNRIMMVAVALLGLAAASLLPAGGLMAQAPGPAAPAAQEQAAPSAPKVALKTEIATFAAGCFWCVEQDFDLVPGVVKTTPGYTGGHFRNPTYELVATGLTGHTEALRVEYDPATISYEKLLDWYWRNVDPTDARGQFCDRGNEYRPAIFVHSAEQRVIAEKSRAALEKSGVLDKPVVVKIEDAGTFYTAEEEHHDYYKKRPVSYMFYRWGCGRDAVLKRVWRRAAS